MASNQPLDILEQTYNIRPGDKVKLSIKNNRDEEVTVKRRAYFTDDSGDYDEVILGTVNTGGTFTDEINPDYNNYIYYRYREEYPDEDAFGGSRENFIGRTAYLTKSDLNINNNSIKEITANGSEVGLVSVGGTQHHLLNPQINIETNFKNGGEIVRTERSAGGYNYRLNVDIKCLGLEGMESTVGLQMLGRLSEITADNTLLYIRSASYSSDIDSGTSTIGSENVMPAISTYDFEVNEWTNDAFIQFPLVESNNHITYVTSFEKFYIWYFAEVNAGNYNYRFYSPFVDISDFPVVSG